MYCDLCGKETDRLYKVNIEGSVLFVCEDCKNYGSIIGVSSKNEINERIKNIKRNKNKKFYQTNENEPEEVIVENYGTVIKKARESKSIPEKDLAKEIGIKESLLLKIERMDFEPSIELAKKFERVLSVKLVEKLESSEKSKDQNNVNNFVSTVGDFVKIKKRKHLK